MGFRTINTWTYYDRFILTSFGNGTSYALDYVESDGTISEVCYLQRDLQVTEFEKLLDACTNETEYEELWARYYFGASDVYDEYGYGLPTDYEVLLDALLNETEYVEDDDDAD